MRKLLGNLQNCVPLVSPFSLPNDVDFALGLFHCKGHSSQSLVCPATIYNGRAQSVSLARFLQSSKLPKTVSTVKWTTMSTWCVWLQKFAIIALYSLCVYSMCVCERGQRRGGEREGREGSEMEGRERELWSPWSVASHSAGSKRPYFNWMLTV